MSKLTDTQKQRLSELSAKEWIEDVSFSTTIERDQYFKNEEERFINESKTDLADLLSSRRLTSMARTEDKLKSCLKDELGFTQVSTPMIISGLMLEKMNILDGHPLKDQVFRVDKNKFLRPMLAPNLYEVMKSLHKVTKNPVCIYEMGSCFRKESQGHLHMNEFTMLNLVEYAKSYENGQVERLKELANTVMKAVGIEGYELEITESEVYGETIDITYEGIELGSGATGPHPLDVNFGIFDTNWVGIGFGVERLTMAAEGFKGIKRVGRSISFLDGNRLNL